MSKTRNTLLAATALVALAGPAFAQKTIVLRDVNTGANVLPTGTATDGVATSNYFLARQIDHSVTADATGWVEFSLIPTPGASYPSGNSKITINLSGGAEFNGAISASWVAPGDNCSTVTVATSTPATSTSAPFVVSNLDLCDQSTLIDGMSFRIPVDFDTATESLSISVAVISDGGFDVDGGNTPAIVAVSRDDAAKLFVTGGGTGIAGTATVATQYVDLDPTDTVTLGNLDIDFDTVGGSGGYSIYADLAYDDITSADLFSASFTVTPTVPGFVGLEDLSLSGTTNAVLSGSSSTLAVTAPAALVGIAPLTIDDRDTVELPIAAQDFSATGSITFTTAAGLSPISFSSFPLAEIVRDGTTVYIPWVASGTKAAVTTSSNVIRVSNHATNAVQAFVRILTSDLIPASSLPTTSISVGIVPGEGELVLTGQSLQDLIGDFGRGDVELVVEGPPNTITVRQVVIRGTGIMQGTVSSNNTVDSGGTPTR